ncbi:MAG: HalOD1 output domain-containing protein [Salinigranum sp.]
MKSDRTGAVESEDLTELHRGHFEPEGSDPASVCVVSTIAEALGRDPTQLPPLRESIDLDHLDGLFVSDHPRSTPAETMVRFRYLGLVVCVWGDGRISVYGNDPRRNGENDPDRG